MREELNSIVSAEFPLIPVLWKGTPVFIRVRELSQVQLYACGDFSLIELEKDRQPFTWKKWLSYTKPRYTLLKMALVSPTYEEIMGLIGKGGMVEQTEKEFTALGPIIAEMKRGPAKQELEELRDSLLCLFHFLFPDDFISSVITYATATNRTDIKKIFGEEGKRMLLRAAILAENGHDNPSDHLDGVFTAFNRDDINANAWRLLIEEKEAHKEHKK